MNESERVPLVLSLCGLPGCGKSSLVRAILSDDRVLEKGAVVCFDDDLMGLPDAKEEEWRLAQCRMLALDRLGALCRERRYDVVLVDDNNFYRSMRKQVWHVVRDAGGWGFLQLYVSVPVALALERNAGRSGAARVPDEVVLRMDARFEVPVQKGWDTALVLDERMSSTEAVKLVFAAWSRVRIPVAVAEPAPASLSSARHDLDLALRREVGALVKDAPSCNRSSLAARLNDVRKDILSHALPTLSIEEALHQLREQASLLLH